MRPTVALPVSPASDWATAEDAKGDADAPGSDKTALRDAVGGINAGGVEECGLSAGLDEKWVRPRQPGYVYTVDARESVRETFDRNLFRIPDTISETNVLMTMVGAKVVYRSRMLGSRKHADWAIQKGAV